MPFHRRNTRLPRENYLGRRIYFVTICCDRRACHLTAPSITRRVLALLLGCAGRHSFYIHAYCAMPDHLHVLAEGSHDDCDLCEFIRIFKLRTAFEFHKSHGRRLWEMSYYDHILRSSDSVDAVAWYIWMNPVRANICHRFDEYTFSGSFTTAWQNAAEPAVHWRPPWRPVCGGTDRSKDRPLHGPI